MSRVPAYVLGAVIGLIGLATPAAASTPLDILLACVAEVGVEGQIETESGGEPGLEFARIKRNRNVSRKEARRINACADGSGGRTGLGLAQPRFAPAPAATAYGAAPQPVASYGCVPGGGVMQRGTLYCVGY